MKIITGDLFEQTHLDAIGHGVNCKGVMGAGIAAQFKKRYPQMYREYAQLCQDKALHAGECFAWRNENDDSDDFSYIYNLASQHQPGSDARYEWLEKSLHVMFAHAQAHNVRTIGLPLIGAGIGGLSVEESMNAIDTVGATTSVELVVVQFK